jgi:hypothetical protein
VSLILEALKKLDREKKTPDRGFLVVGAVPWPAPRPRRALPTVIVLIAGAAAGAALWLAWRAAAVREETRAPVATPSAPPASVAAGPAAAQPAATPPVVAPRATLPLGIPIPTPRPRVGEKPPAMERPPDLQPDAPARPDAPAEPGAGLQLQAISQREGKPVAVLNNRVVHEGDHFDGVTIVRIGADEVEIEVQGRRRTLRF